MSFDYLALRAVSEIKSKAGSKVHHTKKSSELCDDARYWEQDARSTYFEKYGKHFNCKTAQFAVSKFENRDKSNHRWTCDQVEAALKPLGVVLTDCNRWDAYYLANMYYSDLFDGKMFTELHILKQVVYMLGDIDAVEGDIYCQWEAKMMNHCVEINFSEMLD